MPTNTTEPTKFRAGETVTFEKTLSDFASGDGWSLKYTLSGAGGSISKTATVSGSAYSVTFTAAETGALTAGQYKLFGYVEHTDGRKIAVSITTVTVQKNLFTALSTDQRSDNQIILDAIIAVIKGRATKQHQQIAIAGRNIMLLTPAELYRWQKTYEMEVEKEINAERIANGGSAPRNLIQFVKTS